MEKTFEEKDVVTVGDFPFVVSKHEFSQNVFGEGSSSEGGGDGDSGSEGGGNA
jgi:hypothetical protein